MSRRNQDTEIEKLTISHDDMHESPTSVLPEYRRSIYSEGEDNRVEDHDPAPHQAEICCSEIQSRLAVQIGRSPTKPPRRYDQPMNYSRLFHTYSSFDKALMHPSEVGGTNGKARDFPWVIAHW